MYAGIVGCAQRYGRDRDRKPQYDRKHRAILLSAYFIQYSTRGGKWVSPVPVQPAEKTQSAVSAFCGLAPRFACARLRASFASQISGASRATPSLFGMAVGITCDTSKLNPSVLLSPRSLTVAMLCKTSQFQFANRYAAVPHGAHARFNCLLPPLLSTRFYCRMAPLPDRHTL